MENLKWRFCVKIVTSIDMALSYLGCVAGLIYVPVGYIFTVSPELRKCRENPRMYPSHCKDDIIMTFGATVVIAALVTYVTFWAASELQKATKVESDPITAQENLYSWLIANVIFSTLVVLTKIEALYMEAFIFIIIFRVVVIYIVLKYLGELEDASWGYDY